MVTTASQLQFAAELATLLVAAAGLVLFVLRSDLTDHARWARPVALAGFVAVGAVAFLHGSLLVSGSQPAMIYVRAGGYIALGVTSWGWAGRVSPRLFKAGTGLGAIASLFGLASWAHTGVNGAFIVAAVVMAVALALRSRHSIVARLAATAAGSLLVFVLVLAVTLSAVIADSSQRYATNDLRSRAQFEDTQALQSAQGATEAARFVAADLTATFQTSNPDPLIELASVPGTAASFTPAPPAGATPNPAGASPNTTGANPNTTGAGTPAAADGPSPGPGPVTPAGGGESTADVPADATGTVGTPTPPHAPTSAGQSQAPSAQPPPPAPTAGAPSPIPAATGAVRGRLSVLSDLYPVRLAYVAGAPTSTAAGTQLIYPQGSSNVALLQSATTSSILTTLTCQSASASAQITVINNTLVALAAYPVCLNQSSLLGAVEVLSPLDAGYLAQRSQAEGSRSLAVATPTDILASAGAQPNTAGAHSNAAHPNPAPKTKTPNPKPPNPKTPKTKAAQPPSAGAKANELVEKELAVRVEATGTAATAAKSGWLFAAEPLYGTPANRTQSANDQNPDTTKPSAQAGQPVAALVVSSSAQEVINERGQLDETLFLIALGGTVIALLLVSSVGQRITGGLRRLTQVAERVRAGDTGERTDMTGTDEVGALGATFDSMMSAVEQQTEALQEAADDETRLRNRLQAVVAGMGDALVAGDAEGRVTEWNEAASDLLEVRASEAVGRPIVAVVTLIDEDGQSLAEELAKSSPKRWAVTATLLAPGGAEIPVAVSRGPLRGPAGEINGTVLVLRDLRREMEVDRMKSEFLSRVGHELRTPLTGIIGYAEILMTRSVPAPMAGQWHGEILGSAKRLLRIVELLEFFAGADAGAGRIMVRLEPLDVRVLARGVASAWAERTGGDPEVVRRVARHTPMVLGDQRWLTMAIDELIDNAVKFSPKGGRVLLVAGPAADGGVEISVVDRGEGMSDAEAEAAFEDFGQGDSSDTRRFGGLGLGLSLVRRVAEEHNGSVHASSERGVGSTFTMHLPAVTELGGERGITDARATPTSPPAGSQ